MGLKTLVALGTADKDVTNAVYPHDNEGYEEVICLTHDTWSSKCSVAGVYEALENSNSEENSEAASNVSKGISV